MSGRRTTIHHVKCNVCREALSARIDGERELVASEQVDAHLESCPVCCRWHLEAIGSTRRLRLHAVVAVPDMTTSILDRLDALDSPRWSRRYRTVVGLVKLVLRRCPEWCSGRGLRTPHSDGVAEQPLSLPPGARYGRRRTHLQRVDHDPAA